MSETTFRTGLDAGIGRIPIMDVQPVVDGGRFPARCVEGEVAVARALQADRVREAGLDPFQGLNARASGETLDRFATPDEVDGALQKQNSGGGRLEDTLVQSGKLSPEMLARSLAAQLGYEFLDGLVVALAVAVFGRHDDLKVVAGLLAVARSGRPGPYNIGNPVELTWTPMIQTKRGVGYMLRTPDSK